MYEYKDGFENSQLCFEKNVMPHITLQLIIESFLYLHFDFLNTGRVNSEILETSLCGFTAAKFHPAVILVFSLFFVLFLTNVH